MPRKRSEASLRISKSISAKNRGYILTVPQRLAPPPVLAKTILAIDPGGTTGLAVRYPDGSWLTSSITRPSELWNFIKAQPDEVVFETFNTQGRVDIWMIYTIELVGGIKALIYALGIHGFAHTPGRRITYIQEAERMLQPHEHTVHEVDALAHLLAHEARIATP